MTMEAHTFSERIMAVCDDAAEEDPTVNPWMILAVAMPAYCIRQGVPPDVVMAMVLQKVNETIDRMAEEENAPAPKVH